MLHSSFTTDKIEAGCDEAGRGCLAGPVVAAAVILPKGYKNEELDDSKKISLKKRLKLRKEIEAEALYWSVANVSNEEIDHINILNASYKAMHLAIEKLPIKPELLLIDGNRFVTETNYSYECIIKGDGKYLSIAAASILAKTYRDDLMTSLDDKYPGYGWKTNVGYPTRQHRQGIKSLGITPYHRRSFQLLPGQLNLFEV
jgi:ribonuclease HII